MSIVQKKAFLIKVIWLETCHQFMKKRKFSNAKCVTKAFLKRLAWQDIWYQFMNRHVPRSKNLGGHMPDEGLKAFKCKLCDKSFSRKDKMTTHTVSNYEGLKAFRWKCVTKAFLKIVTWLEICHQLMKERKKNLKLLSRITWTSYEANTTFILKKLFSENNWINTSISWITLSTVKYVMNDFLTKIHFFNKLHQFMKAQNMPGNKNQSFIVNNRAKIVYFKVFK